LAGWPAHPAAPGGGRVRRPACQPPRKAPHREGAKPETRLPTERLQQGAGCESADAPRRTESRGCGRLRSAQRPAGEGWEASGASFGLSTLAGLIYGAWVDGASPWLLAAYLLASLAVLALGLYAVSWEERMREAKAGASAAGNPRA